MAINKSKLLSEAIAEARQVKKTAMANAKLAMEETFQPSLQRMISSKLAEDDEMEDDADDLEFNIEFEDEPEGAAPDSPVGMGSFEDDEAPAVEPEGEEDPELEELLRELEGDDEMMDEGDDMFADDEPMDEGQEEDWNDPIQEEDEYASDEEDDIMERLLRELEGDEDEEVVAENEDGAGAYEDNVTIKQMNTENRKLRAQNRNLNKQKNEAYRAVTELRTVINEVNLLNAKLMFTTKTFRQFNLTESQQVRIFDSFDRAKSVREVKLIYTTISESMNKKPVANTKKRMTEGSASKLVKAVNPAKKSLNENSGVLRFQQLAGIAKIEY